MADICQDKTALSPINDGAEEIQKEMEFLFKNVSYSPKSGGSGSVQILHDICGNFKSCRLTAILGPSGAGKTSILNVISGFKAKGVSGNFLLNNAERDLPAFRMMSSYIPQDFAMLDLLTVQETLQVSCDLKLSSKILKAEKLKIIQNILQILNMNKCENTLVRNLSGGERKRLSIAIELITNPPLMFFDEPTSGLDSVSSLQLMTYLRRLALDGRIIVCVIHQPNSRLMKLFDDVLIMSKGEVLYCGPQKDMLPHFAASDFNCPNYYNPADFVLDVGSETHGDNIFDLIKRNKKRHLVEDNETTLAIDEKSKMLPTNVHHTTIEVNSNHLNGNFEQTRCCTSEVRPKTQVSFGKQFSVLVWRHFRSLSRNMISVQLRLIMHLVVGILLGIVFWNIGNDAGKVLSNSACIFFVVLFLFFGNAMPSILLCPEETAVFLREYLNGWYSLRAYYISKIVADLPMQLACPTIMIGIVYFMTGQPQDLGRLGMCWLIALITAFIGHFFGLSFGSMFDLQMAVFLVPGITVPFLIFSGFFIRIHELANYLRPLCDISFFRYIIEGFVQAIYGFDRSDLECRQDFCYYKSPQKFLKDMSMNGERYSTDVVVLSSWILLLVILFFLSLLLRLRKVR